MTTTTKEKMIESRTDRKRANAQRGGANNDSIWSLFAFVQITKENGTLITTNNVLDTPN